jgi:hypothetical protein
MEELIDLQTAQQPKSDELALPEGATSLTLLQQVYRNPSLPLMTRMRAATAALPHEHPRLAVTAVVNSGDFADQLEIADGHFNRTMAKPFLNCTKINATISQSVAARMAKAVRV